MRSAKFIFFMVLFMPLIARASGTAPAKDLPDPLPFFIILLFFAACLILIGIGIVVALAGLAFLALIVAVGMVSTSAIVALSRRRILAGIRAFHYQLFALIAAPCGVVVFGLSLSLLHFHLRHRYILLFGSLAGIGSGFILAFLFDRGVRLIYHRLILRREQILPQVNTCASPALDDVSKKFKT